MRSVLCTALLTCLVGLCEGCRAPEPRREGPAPEVDPMAAVSTLIPAPEDFAARHVGSEEYPIPPYAKFLEGVKICLDPGHGGDAHKRGYKRGGTGVREAEVNLRVAKYLREFLVTAGAEVLLTRAADMDVSLAERAAIANEWDADLFISLHHNAIGNKPHVNYTTVWYHNDVNYRPSNLDLARYLCDGLHDALALEQVTDVPLKSDQLMYESGFAVLRHADVTAALTESSFFTNPEEEQRLRDPAYNLLEAHGLFVGLAKYAAAGLPKAYLIEPEGAVVYAVSTQSPERNQSPERKRGVTASDAQPVADAPGSDWTGDGTAIGDAHHTLVFELDDGLRPRKAWGHERQMILTDTVAARIDGQPVSHGFSDDGERHLLTVSLPDDLPPGEHHVEVQFQNMNKNSILNPHFVILLAQDEDAPHGRARIPQTEPLLALWDAGVYLLGVEPYLLRAVWKDGTVVTYAGDSEAKAGEPATGGYEIGSVDPAEVTEVLGVVRQAGFFEPPIPGATLAVPDGPLRVLMVNDAARSQIWRFDGDEDCVQAIGPNASPSRAEVQAFIKTWEACVGALDALSPTHLATRTGHPDIAYPE